MTIAISTLRNFDFKAITDITLPVLREYCQRHHYTLSSHFSYLTPPDIVWKRLDRVNELMQDHDLVVHVDADVLITNLSVKIEDIAIVQGEHVATSENGVINDGVFIWGEPSWPKKLNAPEIRAQFSSHQDAINSKYGVEMNIRHVPPRTMNSILNAEYGLENPLSEWQPGDFCLHLPALGNARRVQVLHEMINKIQR